MRSPRQSLSSVKASNYRLLEIQGRQRLGRPSSNPKGSTEPDGGYLIEKKLRYTDTPRYKDRADQECIFVEYLKVYLSMRIDMHLGVTS